eukprot:scaffold239070_cov22-Tisochrysis_lutea.AAC.1
MDVTPDPSCLVNARASLVIHASNTGNGRTGNLTSSWTSPLETWSRCAFVYASGTGKVEICAFAKAGT